MALIECRYLLNLIVDGLKSCASNWCDICCREIIFITCMTMYWCLYVCMNDECKFINYFNGYVYQYSWLFDGNATVIYVMDSSLDNKCILSKFLFSFIATWKKYYPKPKKKSLLDPRINENDNVEIINCFQIILNLNFKYSNWLFNIVPLSDWIVDTDDLFYNWICNVPIQFMFSKFF